MSCMGKISLLSIKLDKNNKWTFGKKKKRKKKKRKNQTAA